MPVIRSSTSWASMLLFFLWVAWFMLLFRVIGDVFRRDDLSGLGKTGWLILVILVPFLGVFIYLITQNAGMTERQIGQARARQAQFDDQVPRGSGQWGCGGRDRERQAAARQRCAHTDGVRRAEAKGTGGSLGLDRPP